MSGISFIDGIFDGISFIDDIIISNWSTSRRITQYSEYKTKSKSTFFMAILWTCRNGRPSYSQPCHRGYYLPKLAEDGHSDEVPAVYPTTIGPSVNQLFTNGESKASLDGQELIQN